MRAVFSRSSACRRASSRPRWSACPTWGASVPEELGVGRVVLGAARCPDDEDAEVATEGSAEPRGRGDSGGREPAGGALLLPGGGSEADRHSVGQDTPGDGPEGLPHVFPERLGRRVEEVDACRLGVEADDGEALRGEEPGEEGVGHREELGRSRRLAHGPEEGEEAVEERRRPPLGRDVPRGDREASRGRGHGEVGEEDRTVEPAVPYDSLDTRCRGTPGAAKGRPGGTRRGPAGGRPRGSPPGRRAASWKAGFAQVIRPEASARARAGPAEAKSRASTRPSEVPNCLSRTCLEG